MVLAQGQMVSAAEFEDGAELFSDGTDVSDPIDGSSVTDTDGAVTVLILMQQAV